MSEDTPATTPTPTPLRLDPANAALSLRVRVNAIKQAEQYIRETVVRYDGLRSFERELERMGIAEAVHAICGQPATANPAPAGDEG